MELGSRSIVNLTHTSGLVAPQQVSALETAGLVYVQAGHPIKLAVKDGVEGPQG